MKSSKKILIVTSEFPPQPGGIGNHGFHLANQLSKNFYEVEVITDNRSVSGFEENALKYLNEHPEFKAQFIEKQKNEPDFAKDHRTQLAWIYDNSEWFEKTWKRYPVGKIY